VAGKKKLSLHFKDVTPFPIPMSSALETAKILGEYAEVKRYLIVHFDIYSGEPFEQSVNDQLEFFKKYL